MTVKEMGAGELIHLTGSFLIFPLLGSFAFACPR
jgi:hypothetical protein